MGSGARARGGVQCPWQLRIAEKDAFRSAKTGGFKVVVGLIVSEMLTLKRYWDVSLRRWSCMFRRTLLTRASLRGLLESLAATNPNGVVDAASSRELPPILEW